VAVVTNTLQLDWRSPLFTEASTPTIVICGGASAEVITAGDGAQADLAVALAVLADRGMLHVLTEGGPTLHGELARAGLLDELCVTISPMLAGSGAGTTHLLGPHGLPQPARLRLTNLLEADDGYLFARYRF
jgi:riboflavin biosynthesis pyrimidine reductase